MANGSFTKEDRVATAKDLDINEKDEPIYLDDEVDEEIIQKIEEDDYYDEVIDTLIDKKDNVYQNEEKIKKEKEKGRIRCR